MASPAARRVPNSHSAPPVATPPCLAWRSDWVTDAGGGWQRLTGALLDNKASVGASVPRGPRPPS